MGSWESRWIDERLCFYLEFSMKLAATWKSAVNAKQTTTTENLSMCNHV
jgi:hypothetical protein